MEDVQKARVCPACKMPFQIIYYQRRAADEPPDKVVFCNNCPLDSTKLDISSTQLTTIDKERKRSIPGSHTRALSSMDSHSKQHTLSSSLINLQHIGYRLCIRIEGNAASRCYAELNKNSTKFRPVIVSTVALQKAKDKRLVQIRKKSLMESEAHTLEEAKRIAPLVYLQKLSVYTEKTLTSTKSIDLVVGYEAKIGNIEYAEYSILRTLHGGKQPCILIYLPIVDKINNELHSLCLDMLHQVLILYGTERTIKSFVSSQTINSLFVQSSKAYDWPSAPDTGYNYTWKPDGERFWYIKYGSVWLFSRRLLSGRITGWTLTNLLQEANYPGPIIDTEVMIGYDPIMIDLLVTEDGKVTHPSRSLDNVLALIRDSTQIDIPLHIRNYYRSEKEVLDTQDTMEYPTDGVVGIQDGFMNIIKLKDTKSIELKLKENGDLVSRENKVVINSDLQNTYSTDSIVEVRFTKQSGMDTPTISETLLRTDKVNANEYEVCVSIINSVGPMPDTLSRRNAVQWCSSVRQKINQIASKATGRGRIIMDIGAGDGQAISDYSTDPNITYLLVEPNKDKCNKLLRRLREPGNGQSNMYDGAEHITKAIGLLSNKALKYAVICAKVGDILRQQYAIRTLKNAVRYCTASFSISYIVPDLQQLALNGINVIGCGYMYDSVDTSGILIDEAGVRMQLEGNKKANVKWGSDKTYTENAIVLDDFKGIFHCRYAKTLVPIFASDEFSLLNNIGNKVYIISTKRSI